MRTHEDDVRTRGRTVIGCRQRFQLFQQFHPEAFCVFNNNEYTGACRCLFGQNPVESFQALKSSGRLANDPELCKEQIHEFIGADLGATQARDQSLGPHLLKRVCHDGRLAHTDGPGQHGNRVLGSQGYLQVGDDFRLFRTFVYRLALSDRLKGVLRKSKIIFVHHASQCCPQDTVAKPIARCR